MIERYAVLASRIRQDLAEIERVVDRAEQAVAASDDSGANNGLFLDSAALVAPHSTVDGSSERGRG